MGVTLSTLSTLAPVSFASTVVGFISLAITLLTFIRVFWDNLMTLASAPQEVEDYKGNLKQELYEERSNIRAMKGRIKSSDKDNVTRDGYPLSEATRLKIQSDAVRHVVRDFERLERPFLIPDGHNNSSPSTQHRRRCSDLKNHTSPPYFTKEDDGYDTEQGRRAATRIDEDIVNEEEDYTRTQYCNISLSKRIA